VSAGRRLAPPAVVLLAVVLLAATGFWRSQGRQARDLAAFQKLEGRWQRVDGGSIIEIRHVASGGTLDAAYLNPQPIRVARAEVSRDAETVSVFIELRDLNYPGSTYALTLDPRDDRLKGTYFQAAAREISGVSFTRLKP
jgi:hypothetical protein